MLTLHTDLAPARGFGFLLERCIRPHNIGIEDSLRHHPVQEAPSPHNNNKLYIYIYIYASVYPSIYSWTVLGGAE